MKHLRRDVKPFLSYLTPMIITICVRWNGFKKRNVAIAINCNAVVLSDLRTSKTKLQHIVATQLINTSLVFAKQHHLKWTRNKKKNRIQSNWNEIHKVLVVMVKHNLAVFSFFVWKKKHKAVKIVWSFTKLAYLCNTYKIFCFISICSSVPTKSVYLSCNVKLVRAFYYILSYNEKNTDCEHI